MVQSTHDNGAEASTPAAWSPTPTIWISIGIHAASLLSLASFPTTLPWALAALAINHLVLATAGLSPRSNLLGPNVTRLPASSARRREVALTFDDGPDPHATPQVLDLLDRYAAKASFFCVGQKALAHPAIVREIVRRGHSVENHSQHHSSAFAFYGLGGLRREIQGAQRILAAIAGQAPRFFRAPLGFNINNAFHLRFASGENAKREVIRVNETVKEVPGGIDLHGKLRRAKPLSARYSRASPSALACCRWR